MVIWNVLKRFNLHIWAVLIAMALWLQVHGQGDGSLSMDVPLQVRGLPANMVIVNDLPDHVRLTISGLQTRLKELKQEDMVVPIAVADITTPGVLERALQISSITLPSGLRIQKIQPDRLELQVDRVVSRLVPVVAHLELPEGWQAEGVSVKPGEVKLTGPEVWLDSLKEVNTAPVRPELKYGPFEAKLGVESPSGKAIRLENAKAEFTVRGILKNVRQDAAKDLLGDAK